MTLSIGKADYYGLNYYSSSLTTPSTYNRSGEATFWTDQYTSGSHNASWPVAKSGWLVSVPEGLRGMLKWVSFFFWKYLTNLHKNIFLWIACSWIKNQYDNIEVIITENGWSDEPGELEDVGRIEYYRGHLKAILDAIDDGVNITGHTTWSLLDNCKLNGMQILSSILITRFLIFLQLNGWWDIRELKLYF